MPPHALWLQGAASIRRWFEGMHSELRALPTAANGSFALGVYRTERPGGADDGFDLQVVEVSAGRITAIHCSLDPSLFPPFALPARLDG